LSSLSSRFAGQPICFSWYSTQTAGPRLKFVVHLAAEGTGGIDEAQIPRIAGGTVFGQVQVRHQTVVPGAKFLLDLSSLACYDKLTMKLCHKGEKFLKNCPETAKLGTVFALSLSLSLSLSL
jgi:hypothetical protein